MIAASPLRAFPDGPYADVRDMVRPHAGLLVEAFGLPAPTLADAEPVAAEPERAA